MMMNRAPIRRCVASTARATQEARATTFANAETASATSAYGGGSSSAVDRFDSHSLIKQLRSAQFTEPQAEGVVRATVDAMTRAHFISRDAFERELMSARAQGGDERVAARGERGDATRERVLGRGDG